MFEHRVMPKDAYGQKLFWAERTFPKIFTKSFVFESNLLKSALFRAGTGPRAVFTDYTLVPAHGKTQLAFKGEELRQDDARLLLMILKYQGGQVCCQSLSFKPRTFCRRVLGWADSSGSVAKLRASLIRLQDARVRVIYPNGGDAFISFLSGVHFDPEEWTICPSEYLLELFRNDRTYMDMEERLNLGDGLVSWTYSFIKADACFAPFFLANLRELAGLETYDQKEFNRHLRKALDKLIALGVLKSYEISKGRLLAKKQAARRG